MNILLVVERPEDWPLQVPGVEVVPARRYLTDAALSVRRGTRVFNLCRHYRYQSVGYYVSLLATARGHRPLPSVATVQDLRHRSLVRIVSEDAEREIQRSLAPLTGTDFTLSIYFGENVAKRHARLARQLFNLFPAPLLRATFAWREDEWELTSLRPIAAREIPPEHHDFVVEAARRHFSRRSGTPRPRRTGRYDLAVLVNPKEAEPPSDERALRRFVRAAEGLGFDVDMVGLEDLGRIAEFDALFIRETTQVNHHTYLFSRRAAAEGLVVVDDPDSIVRCTNKVFLAELLARGGIPAPASRIVHRDNVDEVGREMAYPCILKLPDSSFSRGVVRLDDAEAFRRRAREFLTGSELLVAQEFLPTDFDWRVGVLDREVLFAAQYHMAGSHWQIIQRDASGRVRRYGGAVAVPLEEVPAVVLETARSAASLVGDGFYGVDLKERSGGCYVIEVNDNPNLDAGCEDAVLGDELYRRLAAFFLQRIERRREGRPG